MNTAAAWAQIVSGLENDRLDASRERRSTQEQIDVGCPHCTLDDRVVTGVTNEVAQQRYAVETKRAEGIGDA